MPPFETVTPVTVAPGNTTSMPPLSTLVLLTVVATTASVMPRLMVKPESVLPGPSSRVAPDWRARPAGGAAADEFKRAAALHRRAGHAGMVGDKRGAGADGKSGDRES